MIAYSRTVAWIASALFLIFGLVYFSLGMELARHDIYFVNDDIFFGADHLEPFAGWTHLRGEHYHDGAHPLLTLVAVPFGTLFSTLLRSNINGILLLNAGFASLSVTLAYYTIYLIARRPWHSLGPTFFFGFCTSQLFFGSVPETYALAGATLAVIYLLIVWNLANPAIPLPRWVGAGILSFAILMTNFGQTFIAYGILVMSRAERKVQGVGLILRYLLLVLFFATLLSLLQWLLLPESRLFFSPESLTGQSRYIDIVGLLRQNISVISEVVKNFFVVNLIGIDPQPTLVENRTDIRFTYYQAPLHFGRTIGISGLIALLLWGYLFVEGVARNLLTPGRRLYTLIFGTITLYNVALYAVFNFREMFLYSATYTLPVILLCLNRTSVTARYRLLLWFILATATAANNLVIFQRFSTLLGDIL